MTPLPKPGGDPGQFEEKLAQWLLEEIFFRDFLYRNPKGKGGKGELADAVILFDDVALMVQVKAQYSARAPEEWARKAIQEAADQLRGSHRMLFGGHVKHLSNDSFGSIAFDPGRYPAQKGLIILAHEGKPYDPVSIVPDLSRMGFPVHLFSLDNFVDLVQRFDTAGDFVPYLDSREALRSVLPCQVHAEAATLAAITDRMEEILRRHDPRASSEVIERILRAFRRKASGELMRSADWRFGGAIDDIIARIHDRDPSLPWNETSDPMEIMRGAQVLAWLSRDRRIELGKRAVRMAASAGDGDDHYFAHYHPHRSVVHVFLATSLSRSDRLKRLRFLTCAAKLKYGANVAIGVATEPIGPGRSYDLVLLEGEIRPEVRAQIQGEEDPFSGELTALVP